MGDGVVCTGFVPAVRLGTSLWQVYPSGSDAYRHRAVVGFRQASPRRRKRVVMAAPAPPGPPSDGDDSVEEMRSRLEGLFGGEVAGPEVDTTVFDGKALRRLLKERFTVEYDLQPVVRNDRVYIHVLWRYFEQVSFYMDEDEWAEHTEAVADLLKKWNAVDYFCGYIASVKKRPVVGISLNVPIPGVVRGSPMFPTSGRFD